MINKTYVKCNMFKRGNKLFSYYRKNRELYICICKDLYVHFHFYIGKCFTKCHKDTWKSFFLIYSICNYVMYR